MANPATIGTDGQAPTLLRWPSSSGGGSASDTPEPAQGGGPGGFGDAYSLDVDRGTAASLAALERAVAGGNAAEIESAYGIATANYIARYGAITGTSGDAADQLATDLVKLGLLSTNGGHTVLAAVQSALQSTPSSAPAALLQALLQTTTAEQITAQGNQYQPATPPAPSPRNNLVQTYDAGGNLVEERYGNADGSTTDILYDPRNQQTAYAALRKDYDAGGALRTIITDKDNGGSTQQYFDVDNQHPWASTQINYAASGQLVGRTYTQDDGSKVTISYDAAAANGWVAYRREFSSTNDLTGEVYERADGRLTIALRDTAGTQPWTLQTTQLSAAGQVTQVSTANRDGSSTNTDYDVAGSQGWSSYAQTYDSLGRLTKIVSAGRTGITTTVDYDPAAQQSWSFKRLDVDTATGATLAEYQTNDDGSRSETLFDPSGQFGWVQTQRSYDSPGGLSFERQTHADGTTSEITHDTAAAQPWSQLVEQFDGNGHKTQRDVVNDDGSSEVTTYDPDNLQAWSAHVAQFDSAGRKIVETIRADDGSSVRTTFDAAATATWSTQVARFDAQGLQVFSQTNWDDGTEQDVTVGADGARVTLLHDAGGRLAQRQVADAAGVLQQLTNFAVDGSYVTDTFSASGNVLQRQTFEADGRLREKITNNADGSYVVDAYDSKEQQSWDHLRGSYRADQTLASMRTEKDDGSWEEQQFDSQGRLSNSVNFASGVTTTATFDAAGRKTTENVQAANGSSIRTTFDVAGAQSWVSQVRAYNAQGALLSSEDRNDDGTRVRSVFNANGSTTVENYNAAGALTSSVTTGGPVSPPPPTTLPPEQVLPWSGPNSFGDGNQLGISQTSASAKAQWYNIEVALDPLYHGHQAVDFTSSFQTLLGEYEAKFGSLSASQLGAAQFIQDLEALDMIGASNASALFASYQSSWNSGASAATLKSQLASAASASVNTYVLNPGAWQTPGTAITPLPVQTGQPGGATSPPPPPVTVPPPPPPPPTGSGGGGTTTPPQQTTLQDLATSFISGLYTTILGRAPDADGLAYQRDQFIAAATANGIAAAEKQFVQQFANSTEGIAQSNSIWASAQVPPPPPPPPSADPIGVLATQFVSDLYTTILGRPADAGGLATQVAAFRSYAQAGGISAAESDIASQIAHSTEATQRNWVDGASFLTSLYTDVLGRAADAGGLQVQLDAFNAEVASSGIAAAEADFAAAFANSGEGLVHSAAVQAAANAVPPPPPPPPPTVSTQALVPYATTYIRSLYSSILGRSQALIDGDATGVAIQVNAFTNYVRDHGVGAAQVEFAARFADLPEAAAHDAAISQLGNPSVPSILAVRFLGGISQTILGRDLTAEELAAKSASFDEFAHTNGDASAIAEFTYQLAYSAEAATAPTPDAEGFISAMFRSVFGREANSLELSTHTAAFATYAQHVGATQAMAVYGVVFANSYYAENTPTAPSDGAQHDTTPSEDDPTGTRTGFKGLYTQVAYYGKVPGFDRPSAAVFDPSFGDGLVQSHGEIDALPLTDLPVGSYAADGSIVTELTVFAPRVVRVAGLAASRLGPLLIFVPTTRIGIDPDMPTVRVLARSIGDVSDSPIEEVLSDPKNQPTKVQEVVNGTREGTLEDAVEDFDSIEGSNERDYSNDADGVFKLKELPNGDELIVREKGGTEGVTLEVHVRNPNLITKSTSSQKIAYIKLRYRPRPE